MRATNLYFLITIAILSLFAFSCSSTNSAEPVTPDDFTDSGEFVDWGNYQVKVDIENQTAELVVNRDSDFHYDVTSLLAPPQCGSGCLKIFFQGYDPSNDKLTLDFELTNPTALTVSDVRIIFPTIMQSWDPRGWYSDEMLITDGYGAPRAPFFPYSTSDPDRKFYGTSTETVTVDFRWPPGSPFTLDIALTAWLWVHCGDPYDITDFQQEGILFENSGSSTISVRVKDWQDDVTDVTLMATYLMGTTVPMVNTYDNVWEVEVTNDNHRPPSTYGMLLKATSPNPQGFATWTTVPVVVSPPGWFQEPIYKVPNAFNVAWDLAIFPKPGEIRGNILKGRYGTDNLVQLIPGLGNPAEIYVDLKDLDPTNPDFIPYPIFRIDAAKDGSFIWQALNNDEWIPGVWIRHTACTMPENLGFDYTPESDDHRHWKPNLALQDVCDTFEGLLCAVYQNYGIDSVCVQAFAGPLHGRHNYRDSDAVVDYFFPTEFIGIGDGMVDPFYINSFDMMQGATSDEYYIFLSEWLHEQIEVFRYTAGPPETLTSVTTINIEYSGTPLEPKDIELLPPNPNYGLLPDVPLLCVLANVEDYSGVDSDMVFIYRCDGYTLHKTIGDPYEPFSSYSAKKLDTDDEAYAIVMSHYDTYSYISQFTYYE